MARRAAESQEVRVQRLFEYIRRMHRGYDWHTTSTLRLLNATPIRHLVAPTDLCKLCKPKTHSIVLVRLDGSRGHTSSSSGMMLLEVPTSRARLAVLKMVRQEESTSQWTEPMAIRALMQHTHIVPRLLSKVSTTCKHAARLQMSPC